MIHNRLHLPHVTLFSSVPDGQSGMRTNKLSRSSVRTWIPLQALVCISGHRQLRDVKCIHLGQLERGIDNHQVCHRFAESDRVADGERQDSVAGDQLVEPQVQRVLQAVVRPVQEVCDDAEGHVLIARAYGAIASPDGIPQRHSVAQCTIPSGWGNSGACLRVCIAAQNNRKDRLFCRETKPEAKQPFFRRHAFDADVRIEAQHPRRDPELIDSGPRDAGQQIGGLRAEPGRCKCILQGLHAELELGVCFWRRVFQSEEIVPVCIVNVGTTLASVG